MFDVDEDDVMVWAGDEWTDEAKDEDKRWSVVVLDLFRDDREQKRGKGGGREEGEERS